MANPTVRIPKSLLAAVDRAASERGVRPAVIVAQAIRFYLTATDPALVATAVAEILRPLATDIQHIKRALDARPFAAAVGTEEVPHNNQNRNLILELVEQKRRAALEQIPPKSRERAHNADA